MNIRFENNDLEELYTRETGKYRCSLSPVVIERFFERMADIDAATAERDLRQLKAARLEKVPRECDGCYSMRLNAQFRLILKLTKIEGLPGAMIVDVRDYH
jgi:proteic killer suppression protein